MVLFDVLLIMTWIVTTIIVIVDMFKHKVWLGILGIFFFPLTYYHVFKNYSGNKRLVGSVLIFSFAIPFLHLTYELKTTGEQLDPLLAEVNEMGLIQCQMGSSISSKNGINWYEIWCQPTDPNLVTYTSMDELLEGYQLWYLDSLVQSYQKTFAKIKGKGIKVGIVSPSNMYACFEIEDPGVISKSWHTGASEPCK